MCGHAVNFALAGDLLEELHEECESVESDLWQQEAGKKQRPHLLGLLW